MTVSSIGGTYGLSGSGMDIDSIVKKLMTGQQAKEDALIQKKTVLEWQKAAYNKVYDDISSFRSTAFNYKLQATSSPKSVTSSSTSVVTASANAEAANINHSLVVAQLAGGVNLTSTDNVTTGTSKDTIINQIYGGTAPAGSFKVNIANGTSSAMITVDPSGSINELVSQINNAGINVRANYDSTLDRFFLYTTNSGSSSGIVITDSTDNDPGDTSGTEFFRDKLHLSLNNTGQNAEFKLDGVSLSQAGNTFAISGVTYNLTGVSANLTGETIAEKLASGQAANVSVTTDIDKAVDSIQSLVDSYNAILSELNSLVKETRYSDYLPLTDAQREELTESQITAWEAKAKSGMLHNDSTLTSLVNNMRNAISTTVSGISGIYNSASAIGITTGTYSEGGKLYLDTDKLKTAINANPDVLTQLFASSGTTNADGTTNTNSQGIAGRLYDGIKKTMDQLNTIASITSNSQYDTQSNYAKRIATLEKQIEKEQDRYDTLQDAYYTKYNAMEEALALLNTQSSWLSSMFSSNSSS